MVFTCVAEARQIPMTSTSEEKLTLSSTREPSIQCLRVRTLHCFWEGLGIRSKSSDRVRFYWNLKVDVGFVDISSSDQLSNTTKSSTALRPPLRVIKVLVVSVVEWDFCYSMMEEVPDSRITRKPRIEFYSYFVKHDSRSPSLPTHRDGAFKASSLITQNILIPQI